MHIMLTLCFIYYLQVRKGRSHVRMLHIEMAYIKYCHFVMDEARYDPFTQLHVAMYKDLIRLATSRYDDVSIVVFVRVRLPIYMYPTGT